MHPKAAEKHPQNIAGHSGAENDFLRKTLPENFLISKKMPTFTLSKKEITSTIWKTEV